MHSRIRSLTPTFAVLALSLPAQSTLIPVAGARGHVFDTQRNLLYITTQTGMIQRYDVVAQQLLSPWAIGNSLNGCDITPDGQYLYVAENNAGPTQGFIYRIDLNTGQSTTIPYVLDFGEAGAWDIAIASNGKGFLTTKYAGSGWTPVREINVAAGTLTIRNVPLGSGFGEVRQDTHINRGADRSLLFFTESNISSGPVFTYSATTDSFVSQSNTGVFHGSTVSSVNRDGTRIAMEFGSGVALLNPSLATLTTFTNVNGGCIFNTVQDVLYAVSTVTNQIQAYDTNTFQLIQSIPIGQTVSASVPLGVGEMSMADDGSFLFLTTATGVRSFLIGLPEPQVTAVAPSRARYDAGPTPVTISGAFFQLGSNTSVTVGGVAASNVAVINGTTITAVLPAGAPGPVAVEVANSNGSSVLAGGFRYTPAVLAPSQVAAGNVLTITNLFEPNSIVFGAIGMPAAVPVSVPGLAGGLCLASLDGLYQAIWPFDNLTVSFALPLSATGLTFAVQSVELPPLPLPPAFTNCAVTTIQ